jgi:hypothetical protein
MNKQETRKQDILHVLSAFVAQRPGLEPGNYDSVSSYRAELRRITRDRHDYDTLAAAVAWRSIDADALLAATRAFSGRLQIKEGGKGRRMTIEYCTGQYFPTEYRRAACAVLAQALWDYTRDHAMPKGKLMHNSETGETLERYDDLRAGDWLRRYFRREFGARLARRWFN